MTSLLQLNKSVHILITFLLLVLYTSSAFSAVDIWKKKDNENEQNVQDDNESDTNIESPIISEDINKIVIKINEDDVEDKNLTVIGIFDPEENNFDLNMWSETDGEDIKKVLKRISQLKLSKLSEDLLFQVLFTNAYSPKKNLGPDEFLSIKIDWLIKKKRIDDLETLLQTNPTVGKNPKVIKFLINEHLSSADIGSACEKINFIDRNVQNSYLDKFRIYCLINNNQKDEAQLVLDLLREKGFKDKFYEDKINFLLGFSDKTTTEILDSDLLNFYFSHITSENFKYEPNDKTDKYIWRYLSSANLIDIKNFEDENVILTYEQAAAQDSFENDEIFKIYLKLNFNFNQLVNGREIYKNLPNYKARALIYQSILLSDNAKNKIDLAFLLKDLFEKDKLLNVYLEELSNILKSIDSNEIPENYIDLVNENINVKLS